MGLYVYLCVLRVTPSISCNHTRNTIKPLIFFVISRNFIGMRIKYDYVSAK